MSPKEAQWKQRFSSLSMAMFFYRIILLLPKDVHLARR